jgi:hypothetical protein
VRASYIKFNQEDIRAALSGIHAGVEELRVLAPDSGAYINEGDVYETDHECTLSVHFYFLALEGYM